MTQEQLVQKLITEQRDPLKILQALGGFYECPKDGTKRLGPLVGYAGKYEAKPEQHLQYVGEVYANFAVAEQYPSLMRYFAEELGFGNSEFFEQADLICGPQMGGISIGLITALSMNKRFAYIEKKVLRLAVGTVREDSRLEFIRHGIIQGEKVIITEDVLNNFSTTKETIAAVEAAGGEVVGIAGLLNRSMTIKNEFDYFKRKIPVIALVQKPFDQYRQDDPYVIDDITKGNIVPKPKNEWEKLEKAMQRVSE